MISNEEHLEKLARLLERRQDHIAKCDEGQLRQVHGHTVLSALEATRTKTKISKQHSSQLTAKQPASQLPTATTSATSARSVRS